MRAYLLQKTGKPEVLKLHNVADPTPKPQEVKVKIKSIGINYAETLSRRGQYSWAPKRPYIPGMEAYGEIVELGSETGLHKVGDKVIVGQQYGIYAEYACVEEQLCIPAIEEFSPEENAAYLVNFMTGWVALKELCRVTEGESVLIHAAAGGVGTAAVQLAHAMGCFVYGTASNSEKLKLIEELGADRAINYRTEDFYEIIKKEKGGIDCVLEVVGGEVFKKSVALLNPFGRMAVIGFASVNLKKWNPFSWWKTWNDAPKANLMRMAKKSTGIHASHIGYLIGHQETVSRVWEELNAFVIKNQLRPVVGKTFNFEQLPEAHAFMESRKSVGKLVVNVDH